METTAAEISRSLKKLGNLSIAEHSKRFFKTGKGEYGEGDRFLGIRVPVIRKQVKKYIHLSINQVAVLLKSPFHEERLFALLMLVEKFSRGNDKEKEEIYELYLANIKTINNWDLIDISAGHIVGHYLHDKDKKVLYHLAKSGNMWKRRIAIMSTFYFIKNNNFDETLKISGMLLDDTEDLIHKAVGWMLREVGKRNIEVEEKYLVKHYKKMPRTMLRYSIEKFQKDKRQAYLKGKIE